MPSISVVLDNGEVCRGSMGVLYRRRRRARALTVAAPIDMAPIGYQRSRHWLPLQLMYVLGKKSGMPTIKSKPWTSIF